MSVCVSGGEAGVTTAGEQMVEENLEDVRMLPFCLKSQHGCSTILNYVYPPHHLPCYSLFTLMNYCYSGTLSECLSDLRYFGTKHTFCTWLKCQMQLLAMIDRPALQSTQHASLLPSLMGEPLSLLDVRKMRPSGLSDSQYRGFETFVCVGIWLRFAMWKDNSGLLQSGSNVCSFGHHSHLWW